MTRIPELSRLAGVVAAFAVALTLPSCASKPNLHSPDGHIDVDFELIAGIPYYAVKVGGQPFILPSRMGLEGEGVTLDGEFNLKRLRKHVDHERWTSPWGKNKKHTDSYRELDIILENGDGVLLTLNFKAFNDGVAFRYNYDIPQECLPQDAKYPLGQVKITGENTSFNFASDGNSWSIPASFDTYELLYRILPLSGVDNANTPFTFKTEGIYGSIHEANLTDYPEMTLVRSDSLSFKADLAPWPDGAKAYLPASFSTPWRTIQIAHDAPALANSDLILNLNEPEIDNDWSFVKPVKYVGVWWGMHLGINSWASDSRHGATTESAKKYIDFAAANNIQAVLFEGWNEGWETWGSGQTFDFTKSAPDFDIDAVLEYADSLGVMYIMHHETGGNVELYEKQLEQALDWAQERGIHALKTGYAGGISGGHNHHGQFMVRHYRKVLQACAERGIMLDVHEPIKATGLRRTYPNMMCREGARGMEWNAWSEGNPPDHMTILPFTRLLGGPMDYTPGIFDILYKSVQGNPNLKKWNQKISTECRVNTTLAKQLAAWVVIYSPMQMAADLIENYDHPAFEFFRVFDPDFDWSAMLKGEPGEYVVSVSRAKDKFFLGALTDEKSRDFVQTLSFLRSGVIYEATIYADGKDANWKTNPLSLSIEKTRVTSADSLSIKMAPGGGMAVSFVPVAEKQ